MIDEVVAQFNEHLVINEVQIGIRQYITRLNSVAFKEDIEAFADDLLDMVISRKCCIPHTKLVKYGVLTPGRASSDTLRIIRQYEFVEGVDYQPALMPVGTGGGKAPKAYYLSPRAFELCLMRARNTRRYSEFFSMLRECIFAYDKYQLAIKDRALAQLTARNGRLEELLQGLGIQNTDILRSSAGMRADIGELKTDLQEIKSQNVTLIDGVAAIKRQSDVLAGASLQLSARLGAVSGRNVATAADIALPPDDSTKSDSFVLLALDNVKYHVLRIQTKSVTAELRKQRSKYPHMREVLHLRDVPNSKHLWNRGRETLDSRIRTTSPSHTTFTLSDRTTEAEVASTMRELHAEPIKQAEDNSIRTRAWVDAQLVEVDAAQDSVTRVLTTVETTVTKTKTTTIELSSAELDAAILALFED